MTNDYDLSRRKILGGIVTIGAAGAAAGAGTMAYFSDTETSSGNQIQAGTLDLTPDGVTGFSFSPSPIAPGESAGSASVGLENSGTLDGSHLEFDATITGESDSSASTDYSTDKSAEEVAKRLFVTSLQYDGNDIGWGATGFSSLVDNPGSAVFDINNSGTVDVEMSRVNDPANGSREGVVHVTSGGSPTTDYAVSMNSVSSTRIDDVTLSGNSTPVAYDYYGGANNENSAPDEVYLVIDDGGTRRLLYHAGNDGSPDGETWEERDVGAEITGDGTPLNSGYNWFEVSPDGSNSYPDPSSGGLLDSVNNGSLASDTTIEAVGFGRGRTGSSVVIDIYYDNLRVGSGSASEFRPLTLFDVARRGVIDDLPGLAANNTEPKTFSMDLVFDEFAGNEFQADGVTVAFDFALAQTDSQDILPT